MKRLRSGTGVTAVHAVKTVRTYLADRALPITATMDSIALADDISPAQLARLLHDPAIRATVERELGVRAVIEGGPRASAAFLRAGSRLPAVTFHPRELAEGDRPTLPSAGIESSTRRLGALGAPSSRPALPAHPSSRRPFSSRHAPTHVPPVTDELEETGPITEPYSERDLPLSQRRFRHGETVYLALPTEIVEAVYDNPASGGQHAIAVSSRGGERFTVPSSMLFSDPEAAGAKSSALLAALEDEERGYHG